MAILLHLVFVSSEIHLFTSYRPYINTVQTKTFVNCRSTGLTNRFHTKPSILYFNNLSSCRRQPLLDCLEKQHKSTSIDISECRVNQMCVSVIYVSHLSM